MCCFFILFIKRIYYFTNSFTLAAILSPSNPNSLISSTAGPECPNTSFTPICNTGVGSCSDHTSHTARPNPPITECSSTVTTLPVAFAASNTSSVSNGFTVAILIT